MRRTVHEAQQSVRDMPEGCAYALYRRRSCTERMTRLAELACGTLRRIPVPGNRAAQAPFISEHMSTDAATRRPAPANRKPIVWIVVACALIAALALAWRFTPLAQSIDPRHIAKRLEAIEKYPWSPFAFIAAYVLGGLVMFPVTVMSAATAIIFPPLKAVSVSFTGIMLSAALLHWIGARWIGERVRSALGSTIEKVDHALSDRGIVTIATLRMIPL